MSRFIDATCNADGKVFIEGFEITGALILGEGKAQSSGLLFIDGPKLVYMPKSVSDLVTTLDKISAALDTIQGSLEKIDAKAFLTAATAGVPSPPFLVSEISAIGSIKSEIDSLKGALK